MLPGSTVCFELRHSPTYFSKFMSLKKKCSTTVAMRAQCEIKEGCQSTIRCCFQKLNTSDMTLVRKTE